MKKALLTMTMALFLFGSTEASLARTESYCNQVEIAA